MQAEGGARNELLDPAALAQRFPSLDLDGIALGSFGPEDGWTDPHAILMGLRRKVQAMGASLIQDEVLGIGCDANGAPATGSRPNSSFWIGSSASRSASFASG